MLRPDRDEIQTVLVHQDTLLQQYRSLLYAIQSLFFGAFFASFTALWAVHMTTDDRSRYCISKLSILDTRVVLFATVLTILVALAVVGVLVFFRISAAIGVRSRNVTFCRSLLVLDELGLLEEYWRRHMVANNGRAVGIHVALRIFEGRLFAGDIIERLRGISFEGLMKAIESVQLVETGVASRGIFNTQISLYFLFLFFVEWVAVYFFVAISISC